MAAVECVMTIVIVIIAGAAVLAFANGANDVSKGIATLAGSGRTSYRSAIAWGLERFPLPRRLVGWWLGS